MKLRKKNIEKIAELEQERRTIENQTKKIDGILGKLKEVEAIQKEMNSKKEKVKELAKKVFGVEDIDDFLNF